MNWTQRIEAAKARDGIFTMEDRRLSSKWVTCACGEQDPRIPRRPELNNIPMDTELRNYGVEFCNAVYRNNPGAAAKVLGCIETRAAQILSDLAAVGALVSRVDSKILDARDRIRGN